MNALSPSLRVFAPLTRNSADTLNWLAALFAMPPSVDSIAAHRGGPAAEMLREIAADPKLAPGVALMRETLDQPDDDSAVATRLGRSYGLLFEGIGGPNTVPPYESAFRAGGAWRLFQAPTSEMEALLAEHDLSVATDAGLPADHLAIELALAAHLIAAEEPVRGAEMIRRLAGWVPAFADACADADSDGFWAGAAYVVAAVMAREDGISPTIKEEAEARV